MIINGIIEALKMMVISSFSIAICSGLIYLIGIIMQYSDKKFNKKVADIINSMLAIVAVILTCFIVIAGMVFMVAVTPFAIGFSLFVTCVLILSYIIIKLFKL